MGYQLVVGPDGELSLPETVRDALGLKPGDVVRVEVDPAGHSLTMSKGPRRPAKDRYSLEDLIGMGGSFPRAVTAEEMDEAIGQAAAERYQGR